MDNIEILAAESQIFNPPVSLQAHIKNREQYLQKYNESINNPEQFWTNEANNFLWFKKWHTVLDFDWLEKVHVEWFKGAQTNITLNAIDRFLPHFAHRSAFIWIGNEPNQRQILTYSELSQQVNQFANVLKSSGIKKGDRVAIYMPMILELPVAMLACARLGAIHSVVFGGFSAESLKSRLIDAQCTAIITADGTFRGEKNICLKEIVDDALNLCLIEKLNILFCFVVRHTQQPIQFIQGRDIWWHEAMRSASTEFAPAVMEAEDPLFILYTSGSTGKPKGVLHTTAGYMVYVAQTFKYVFDYQPQDIYWCTADMGWITGHSYGLYGPLLNGATSILFEGVPNYPNPDRFWQIIADEKVNIFYTSPTALRSLIREEGQWLKTHDLKSLRLLGTVGEPINPEVWLWYYQNIGQSRCPIVDTWWQTETGGILLAPLPFATATKPGSATLPLFGIEPAILREDGSECLRKEGGALVFKKPWPGIMRTIYGFHERFKETYFSKFAGYYHTGDTAYQDDDGYFWILGRSDDVLKISGHRIGTAEVESALVAHPAVAEAAVVGIPHLIKGQAIYAFVTLKNGVATPSFDELVKQVRQKIGPLATPQTIQFALALPKTRSGKIMRRILKGIATGQKDGFGDVSTLTDPLVIQSLVKATNSGCLQQIA